MSDWSDWVWLAVGLFYVLFRLLPRLFRSKTGAGEPKPRPKPARTVPSFQGPDGFGKDSPDSTGPRPIEPK